MAATSQPISIVHNQRSGGPSSHNAHVLSPTLSHLNAHHTAPHLSPHHSSQSSLLAQHAHLANPRWAGTSPRSAESSTSWAIHPGPLFVSAGSLGSTSGSFGAASASGSVGSMRSRMYPGCSPGVPLLNPLEPDFKYRGVAGSIESDHGSLINSHMSEREVEQFRNFTCCGLPLTDLHALVEHFEAHHVFVDSLHPLSAFPPHPSSLQAASGSGLLPNPNGNVVPARSTDSSLAGALGPSSSPSSTSNNITGTNGNANAAVAPPPSAFDPDDMDLDMEMEMELEPELEVPATSPAPSNISSVSSPNSNSNSNSSTRSSPLGGGAGPLPLTQPQRFANANSTGANRTTNGTRSSVSSPPDTPLLTTPVSPFATAPASAAAFPWAAQAHDGLMTPIGPSSSQTQSQTFHSGQGQSQSGQGQGQAPAGPSAFDSVHLPPKHSHGGMFAHPYACASSARRHAAHPMSPLSSASSVSSTSGTTSPSSASASACASGFGYPSGLSNALANGHAGGFLGGTHGHGLHHTQSLYALRLARYAAAEREREREEAQLIARALNGYAGYEDYSRGFPGTGDVTGEGVGIAGGVEGVGAGIGGDMGGMGGTGGMGRMSVGPTESAIHPGLLFGNMNGSGAMNGVANGHVKTEPSANAGVSARTTPAPSRSGSPSSSALASASTPTTTSTPSTSTAPVRKAPTASTTLSRPSSSLLLSKPFKCPTPGCTKSYKQANGLKYHVTHGQCSFTPPPELSSISELGLSIGLNLKIGPMGIEGLEGMSERDRREAEREAERRLRPFCCQVKPCQRRYKNMNGLRYHYQHSGEHGAQGLRMLASGRHDATRSQSVEEDEREGSEGERERERKEGQTSSAPSTPGPRASQNAKSNSNSLFTTQAFAFQQQQTLHQRSLSNSSQPLSPLSQHFPSSTATASSSSSQFSSPSMQFSGPGQGQGQGQGANSINGVNSVNGGHAGHAGQYGFAVQSQPASAYASPWGSRAGSPTSSGGSGVNCVQVQSQWGSQGMGQGQGQGQGQDAMMAP